MAGEGAPFEKGSPFPRAPLPPKTFIWVRGLPERCDLRAPVLIRSFVGVSFPSSPAFPLCPATGSALIVLEEAVHAKAVCLLSSCVKALLPMMGQRDLRMLLSLHGSRVSACADAARPHAADGAAPQRPRPCSSAAIACHAGAEIFSQNCRPRCQPDVASPYARLTRSKFDNLIIIFQHVIGLKIFLSKK